MKLVFGVGTNDADYSVIVRKEQPMVDGKRQRKVVFKCPYYHRWQAMLQRCYSKTSMSRRIKYRECFVCEEWLTFSNFKSWMEKQDWEGRELDKDLLIKGNKVYSPETCVFVSREINLFITECDAARGDYLIGVHKHSVNGTFVAQINLEGKRKNLGSFSTEIEAHRKWLTEKQKLAKLLAEGQTDSRVANALIERYTSDAETLYS